MLDQQFFGDKKFHRFLNTNFVSFHLTAGTQIYSELSDKYYVRATPTVLILNPDGTEVDRVVGFDPPADGWKEKYFDKAYKGENTFYNLKKKYDRNPSDLDVNVKLIQKYERQYNFKAAEPHAKNILNYSEDAEAVTLKYRGGTIEVSAYEMAKFIYSNTDPEKSLEYINEFKDSKLADRAVNNYSNFYYNDEKRDKALKVFDSMYKAQPDNSGLIAGYIGYSANRNVNVEKSLKLGKSFYKKHPDKMISEFVLNYTTLLINSGKKNDSKGVVKTFHKNNPDETYIYRDLGQLYVDNGAYDLGFKAYDKYLELEPGDQYGLYSIGRAAAISGKNLDRGIETMKAYLKQEPEGGNPSHAAVYWRLGMIYEHKKDIEKAVKSYESSLKLDSKYEGSIEALSRLKEKR
ncbi:MAG: tetratricopeptide repeat protein [bacterium]|nr:tetratricopeptide repeat protein [bacterium]